MTTSAATDHEVRLDIQGMTCASCAMRIEKKLNKLDGVQASVNYALGTASVQLPQGLPVERLVQTVEAAGYQATVPSGEAADGEAPEAEDDGRGHLIAVWLMAIPVIAVSMIPALQFPGWQWAALALTVPVVLWGGWSFHRAAWQNARHATATMDTLVSVGTLAALAWSVYAMVFGDAGMIGMRHHFELTVPTQEAANAIYLEAAAGVTAFLLLGRYLEARSKRAAGAAVRGLLNLRPADVLLADGSRVPLSQLDAGDVFVVRPGDRIATDGVVVDGSASIDASAVTGESVPVEVSIGDEVVGGTLAAGGSLRVRASAVGADTELSRIAQLVEHAQDGKAGVQWLADRVAGVFVPVILVLALATLLGWSLLAGDVTRGFTAAVAVLVIACPCALGLATPVALLVGTGRGAQLGILIRGPQALEQADAIDTVVLDKTGTLTDGRMSLVGTWAADGDTDRVLRVAAALEADSAHPIARAIAGGRAGNATGFHSYDGGGVAGRVDGADVLLGRVGLLTEQGIAVPDVVTDRVDQEGTAGRTAVVLAIDGQVAGVLSVADQVRDTAPAAVARFRELGLRPVLLTGDHQNVASAVAARLGIDEVHAQVLPSEKAALVERLQAGGAHVAMVGDGVNDAAALATAELGIAMGSGADVAADAADVTLLRSDPLAAVDAVRLSRATLRVIRQNIAWAFAYNLAAVPLAMSGRLGPMIAGFAMAASSVLVVLNSLRLRRFE